MSMGIERSFETDLQINTGMIASSRPGPLGLTNLVARTEYKKEPMCMYCHYCFKKVLAEDLFLWRSKCQIIVLYCSEACSSADLIKGERPCWMGSK